MMLPWLLAVIGLYAMILGTLYVAQDGLLFPREATHRGALPLPDGVERHELASLEGHRLVGHVLRRADARAILLVFTGNAWNAEDCLIFTAERVPDAHLVAFHYRGYAPSEGAPSEAALIADAIGQRDLAQHLLDRRDGAARLPVVAIGYSIGTGVAARLAGDGQVDGAVLVTPFDSVEAVAQGRYFFAPVPLLLKHKFRSDVALAGKDIPVAVIAAAQDQVIPPQRTAALLRHLARPVMVETVDGAGHASLYDLPVFDRHLVRAVTAVLAAVEHRGTGQDPATARTRALAASGTEGPRRIR
jgi:pimeloyl-ACP methyl ester carboxylesterase